MDRSDEHRDGPRAASAAEPPWSSRPARELALLAALPARWWGQDAVHMVGELAALLRDMLEADLLALRVEQDEEVVDHLEPARFDRPALEASLAAGTPHDDPEAPDQPIHLHVEGVAGVRSSLVVGARRQGFPTREERFLAGFAARQLGYALQAERERLLTRERELAASRKDQLIAMLGHELRNPLSTMTNALELMRRRHGPLLTGYPMLVRQVRYMARVLDDIQQISRIERGQLELERDRVVLADVIAHAMQLAASLIEERRQRLDCQLTDHSLACRGDATRLTQVVSNLLTNASKYSDPGARIDLRLRREGALAVLEVEDRGIGIEPAALEELFEPFVRGDEGRIHDPGGLGLGLALVRHLVREHGGDVRARSAGPGQGSTFVVRLPLEPPTDAPAGSEATASGPGDPLRPPAQRRRVLVVHDNRGLAELFCRFLEYHGHDVTVACDRDTALAAVGEASLDVAIIDVDLPGIDGPEVARRIRAAVGREHLRVYAMSGFSPDRVGQAPEEFDGFFVKPVLPSLVLQLLGAGGSRG